uniref:Uncharacterized protein n=1 Tax=Gossypium raimondii TaxID=29730 RepID=A0A0D2PUS3_GOSRA|nr:hypothetical protein B456_001G053200 [Gossypium raimondii]
MAGLQYNFFPTDFFYPRPPQPAPVLDSTPPSTVPIQKRVVVVDGDNDGKQRQPGTPVVHRRNNKTSVSMRRRQGEKVGSTSIYVQNPGDQRVKLPENSFSSLILVPEQDDSDSN